MFKLKTLTKAARLSGMILLFVMVLELCARFDDWLKWDAPFWSEYSSNILTVTDSLGRHNRPNASYEKWRINGAGFRGPEVSFEKPSGVTRIIIVGASETFGLSESPGKEYAAQMQSILDSIAPGDFQVLNASAAGMTPPRITHYFNSWLKRFDPDILVFYPSPTFYLDFEPPGSKFSINPSKDNISYFSLRLKRKVSIVFKQFIPAEIQTYMRQFQIILYNRNKPEGWAFEKPPWDRLDLFRQHVSDLIQNVRQNGTDIILATHAHRFSENLTDEDRRFLVGWRKFFPRATESCILDMEAKCNEIINELGGVYGIRTVDISTSVPKTSEYFSDFSHFTDRGAFIVASEMVSAILEMNNVGSAAGASKRRPISSPLAGEGQSYAD